MTAPSSSAPSRTLRPYFLRNLPCLAAVSRETPTTTAPAKAAVGTIESATSLEPNGAAIDPATEVSSDNTVIYTSVQMKPFPEGTVVEAAYEMGGTKLTDASITAPSDFADVYLQFKLTSGGTFEPGEYTFTVTVDGEAGPSTTFTVTA